MSILPIENQGPTSSSNHILNPQNPNCNHGSDEPQLDLNLQSIHISDNNLNGSVAPTMESSGGSSRKVKDEHKLNGKKIPTHQKSGAPFQHNGSGQSSVGYSQHRGSPGSQNRSRSTNQGGTLTSAGRRGQGANANYLLNFQYDPIARPQARVSYPRRPPKRKPYNKDLFLQANYKFVLLDSGNRAPESMDPDKMLQWEDIICLKYFTPHPTTCPICLEELLCPQMTSCGHIFCFPCILRYFLIGEDEHKRECWKKCPLCFMMISSKDLYTIYIENVKQHCVGDIIEFMLLTRDKDSLTLNAKQKETVDAQEEVYDSFSKFTFTSDVELSVRKAMSELDSWLARAESGLVDDLERLPYVCAAMEQLEERKKYWKEHRGIDGVNAGKIDSFQAGSPPSTNFGIGVSGWDDESFPVDQSKLVNADEPVLSQTADMDEPYDGQSETLSSSPDDSRGVQMPSDGFTDKKIKASYDFYQAADGQHLILHPLNMKCLLHHYGSYDRLPQRISGKILQLETITQSEAIRRRYRYLSHFSLTTTFQLCEIDLSGILPPGSLSPFGNELKNREKQRTRVARKEQEEKAKAEAAAASYVPVLFDTQPAYDYSPAYSLDDFEALGSSSVSSPPTVVDRPLFSNVARLGFASAHDSPILRTEETNISSGSSTALPTGGTTSFANVISRAKPVEAKAVEIGGKKGKKASRVLLSTSGGRRPGKLFSNIVKPSDSSRTEETNMSSASSTALPTGSTTSFANVISRAKSVEAKADEIGGRKERRPVESCYQHLVVVGINKGDNHLSVTANSLYPGKLFSNIVKPSDSSRTEETNMSSASSTALPTGSTTSFANVISRAKSVEAKADEIGGRKERRPVEIIDLISLAFCCVFPVEKWIVKATTADNYISIRLLFLSIKDPANDVDSEPCNELKIQELIQY
nr:RING finger protein 10 isoform X2 [Tanacetum cinerariifolium]